MRWAAAALTAAALARAAALTPTETALWTWAESQGANVSRIVPTTGVYGRGLAAVDGSQGELLSLPRHLIMGCEAVARVALELPGVVAFTGCEDGVGRTSMRFAGGFEAWDGNTLVVFVAHHRLLGAASPWAPYLDSLPASFDTLPPYLLAVAAVGGSAEEAVRAMDAADAFEGGALRDVVQKEASKWLYFSRLVAAAFADHAGVEATRALRTVLWAKAIVATRAVHLSSLGRSLVPFWDLINHGGYAAKREVVDDERVAYIRDAPSDGGELVHDYQLSSSTGGACAWDWLITFGFVPRDAQKVVACARVRVRGEVFELPADAAALARLDGEDARRALEGALLALPPEDALRDDTGDAAYVKLLERRALLDALRGGAPKEVVRHAVVVDGRAETIIINYAPCGNITKAARAFVDEHLTDLTDEARRDHVNRLRPMLASKIDDHACASKRADDGEVWLHEETRVISVIGYSTPVSGHDLVTFTPVWKSTSASGAPDNSSLSHFSAMMRPSWLGRAVRNQHRHAIEQVSRRWRRGRRDDSARTRRKIVISTQIHAPRKSGGACRGRRGAHVGRRRAGLRAGRRGVFEGHLCKAGPGTRRGAAAENGRRGDICRREVRLRVEWRGTGALRRRGLRAPRYKVDARRRHGRHARRPRLRRVVGPRVIGCGRAAVRGRGL